MMDLSTDAARAALRLAHDHITAALEGKELPLSELEGLAMRVGHFVSLHKAGHLRGCMGVLESEEALWRALPRTARLAAFEDPRFPALKPHEWPQCQLELSLLTPFTRIAGVGEIEVGRHGILLEARGHRALFLPQVAVEQGWTREETLAHLCLKAGLPQDAWQGADCRFLVFEALVIREDRQVL